MSKKIFKLFLFLTLFLTFSAPALAAEVNINIRNGNTMIFSGIVALPTDITSVNDSESAPHELDSQSVLAALLSADGQSENFEISNITYYSSFGSLYLKCLTGPDGELCDNWQYVVDGNSPSSGIDQEILSGGETIWLYFGPTSRIELSADQIDPSESVIVYTQKYDYEDNAWIIREGVTVGLTQPNPDDPFSPLEIMTGVVDMNGQIVFADIPMGEYDVGIKDDFYFPTEKLTVRESSGGGSAGSSGSSSGIRRKASGEVLGASTEIKFNLEKAFEFLLSNQKEDGSFGPDLYTDWSALALATGNHQNETIKLIKYLGESKLENPRLTDYERRAIALMSLGLNPYGTSGENYVGKIISAFDGIQFGNISEDNDDIFALIVLQNAGYKPEEEIMQKSAAFVLQRQKENGSWDESTDMTGAAMEALSFFSQTESVKSSLLKAKDFLKQIQKDNGGWNDSASSTAWVMEGILALGEKPEEWTKKNNSPLDYLATLQDTDGGIKGEILEHRIWETAYVIPALSGKNWNQIMQDFAKQETQKIVPPPKKSAPKTKTENLPVSLPPPEEAISAVQDTIVKNTQPPGNWFTKLLRNIFGL